MVVGSGLFLPLSLRPPHSLGIAHQYHKAYAMAYASYSSVTEQVFAQRASFVRSADLNCHQSGGNLVMERVCDDGNAITYRYFH